LNKARLEGGAFLDVDDRLAILFEDRLHGKRKRVLHFVDDDFDVGQQAGPQQDVEL